MSEIKTSHYKIRSPLSRPWQPFSLVLLADLHNASFGPRNERLLQEIRAADPRAVLRGPAIWWWPRGNGSRRTLRWNCWGN